MSNDLINSISQCIHVIWVCFKYILKNAGLNTTQRWVKYGRTQQLDTAQKVGFWKNPSLFGSNITQHCVVFSLILRCHSHDRWLNVWCIWYTYLETLQKWRSHLRIGWIIQDFRETYVAFFNILPGNKDAVVPNPPHERRKPSCLQLWWRTLIRVN